MNKALQVDLDVVQGGVDLMGTLTGQYQLLLVEVDVDLFPHDICILVHEEEGRTDDQEEQHRAEQHDVPEVEEREGYLSNPFTHGVVGSLRADRVSS